MAVDELKAARRTRRRLDKKHTHTRRYVIEAIDQGIATQELTVAAPPMVIVDNKLLIMVDVEVSETDNATHFIGEVNWATKDNPKTKHSIEGGGAGGQPNETNDSEQSFSIGGGTQHVQAALFQTAFGDDAPDMGEAINVGNDGIVGGIDILISTMTFNKTHYLPNSIVTTDFIRNLRRCVGTVSLHEWEGYANFELLLLSATGSQRGADDWSVTYEYSAGVNQTDLTVAGISDITKLAHDYLWVLYEQSEDDTKKKMVPKAVGVYVSQVYKHTSFADYLGI